MLLVLFTPVSEALIYLIQNCLYFNFQVISLELSTGIPMLYISKEGKFIRRGSPAAPTEAGVYAYTKVCYFPIS